MTSTAPKTGPSPVVTGIYKKPQLQQTAIEITNLGALSVASPTVQVMAHHSIIINGGNVDGVKKKESVFVVILTSDNYLAGVILLHYSIKRHSKYPLVVAVVPSRVSQESIQVLKESGCRIRNVEYLAPECEYDVVAERFRDTWTKLRVFELHEFERIVLLDADMLLFHSIDELFAMDLPKDWVAATHACVCNKKRASWGSKRPDWIERNCPFTPLRHPEALTRPAPSSGERCPETWRNLNSGLVVLQPSKELADRMKDFLYTSPLVKNMGFPDQDFLTHFFRDKWIPLGWQYNAPKNMRHWHPEVWKNDEDVKVLHYIVAKPWMAALPVKDKDWYVTSLWWDLWRDYEENTPKSIVDRVKATMDYIK